MLALTGTSFVPGLRQNATDRSNLALQHAGTAAQGTITLRLTVFSGNPGSPSQTTLPDLTLNAGEFSQLTLVLQSQGLNLNNGFVKIDRIAGTAPYYAYGVINDQVNDIQLEAIDAELSFYLVEPVPTRKRVALVVGHLTKRPSNRPSSVTALKSLLESLFRKKLPNAELDVLVAELKSRGVIRLNGKKLEYDLTRGDQAHA